MEKITPPNSFLPSQALQALATGHLILVAVSKKQPDSKIIDALKAGYTHFGENTLQGLTRTAKLLQDFPNTRMHFVGRLQSNKIKKICSLSPAIIHSVAQQTHMETFVRLQQEGIQIPQLLLQINCAQNQDQEGLTPELEPILDALNQFSSLPFVGLMTMGGAPDRYPRRSEWLQVTHLAFAKLTEIRRELQHRGFKHICHLSMGMSEDYEIALQEGATLLRLGTLIFGPRPL